MLGFQRPYSSCELRWQRSCAGLFGRCIQREYSQPGIASRTCQEAVGTRAWPHSQRPRSVWPSKRAWNGWLLVPSFTDSACSFARGGFGNRTFSERRGDSHHIMSQTEIRSHRFPFGWACLKNRGRFLVYLAAQSSTRAIFFPQKGHLCPFPVEVSGLASPHRGTNPGGPVYGLSGEGKGTAVPTKV